MDEIESGVMGNGGNWDGIREIAFVFVQRLPILRSVESTKKLCESGDQRRKTGRRARRSEARGGLAVRANRGEAY